MRILLAAIYPYVFLLLYLIIPFDTYIRALPNILLAILVLTFPFIVKKRDFRKLKSWPFAVFLALVFFLLGNSLIAGRIVEDFNIIKKILIAIGLVVLYIPVIEDSTAGPRTEKINSAIIFSSLAAIVYSVYNFVLITHVDGNFALGESPQVIEALLIDRLYLGLLSTFSILISLRSIKKTYHPNNTYHLANIFINALFILFMASKIAMVSLLLLILIRQFYGKRKIWKLGIATISVVAIVGLFFLIRGYSNKQLETDNLPQFTTELLESSMTYELRSVVWHCASNIIGNDGISWTGDGFLATEDKLLDCYSNSISNAKKRNTFIAEKYNTHNQFLDFYLSAGLIALLLFLVFIAVSFISVRNRFLPTALLTLFILYCSVENVFHRQIGAYYIGFILIVLLTSAKSTQNNRINEM